MKILVVNWRDTGHPETGGAETHFHELFRRMVQRGHEVSLLTTHYPDASSEDVIDGIKIYRWGHTYTFNWESPFLIKKLLRHNEYDCIVDDVNKIPFFTPKWLSRKRCGVFFHHLFGNTIFDLAWYPLARYVLFLENRSAWGYKGIPCCTVSPSTRDELIRCGFDANRITIIENSVDTDLYVPPKDAATKRDDLLVYTGRLKRYKNVALVFEVLKHFREGGRDIRFAVAGAGDDENRLRQLADAAGVSDLVDFLGYISEEEKVSLLQRATLFVNPSHKEGWGITNIEANACGTAVVANDAPGLRDSVRHEKTGLLYKENDLEEATRCIEHLLADSHVRGIYEKQGREWACEFSWDRSSEKVEKWLKEKVAQAS